MELSLSNAAVARVSPPRKGRIYIYDSKLPGLVLQVTATGCKSFQIYKKVAGRPVRKTLGRFPIMTVEAARKQATLLLAEMLGWTDPVQARTQTYDEIFHQYFERHARHQCRTYEEIRSIHRRYFGRWLRVPVSKLKSDEIEKWILSIPKGNRYKATANKCLGQMRAVIQWAMEKGLVLLPFNPAKAVEGFTQGPRKRVLTVGDEATRLAAAIDAYPDARVRDCLWLLAHTGARKSNALRLRWEHIDWTHAQWNIPEDQAKNGEHTTLPLIPKAMMILRRRREEVKGPWVFPGDGKTGHLVAINNAWRRICKVAGIQNLRIHDLRRTMGTTMANNNVNLPIIGKAMGHRSMQSTMGYIEVQTDPVRQAIIQANQKLYGMDSDDQGSRGV